MEQFDINHFLLKFAAIPEDKIIMNHYTDDEDETKHCSIGHCSGYLEDLNEPTEANALRSLFKKYLNCGVTEVNDNWDYTEWKHLPSPKQRIMAALNQIKILSQQ